MSKWREKFKVHPAADVFPMMSDEELAELGEDIKTNGLRRWVTVDRDGFLIDGRNRLEAMERAGIEIEWVYVTKWDGDPVAYITSANIHRRHLSKQQRAELIVAVVKAIEDHGGAR